MTKDSKDARRDDEKKSDAVMAGEEKATVKFRDENDKTQERDAEAPLESQAPVLPDPTGTDDGAAATAEDEEVDDLGDTTKYNKDTGFHESTVQK